jgi:Flp pilus assembly protein TadD
MGSLDMAPVFSDRFVLVLLVVPALLACGGPLAEGKEQFKQGQYPAAKQTFAAIEAQSRSYDDGKRAEYALYRGLTLNALGDRAQAESWLREAKAILDTNPRSLAQEDALRLKQVMENSEAP